MFTNSDILSLFCCFLSPVLPYFYKNITSELFKSTFQRYFMFFLQFIAICNGVILLLPNALAKQIGIYSLIADLRPYCITNKAVPVIKKLIADGFFKTERTA